MTNAETKQKDATLRNIFTNMDAHQGQDIRESYYKAVEGLYALAEALEIADAQQTPSGGPLIEEHLLACEAIEAMKKSRLGAIL
ncbi:hypothetical protein [Bremerella sp.]|uniref:hypothetical protein n=1 Tax=Bremerella sp. TaxID=2795602 RepID=UPI00391925A4